MAGDYAILAPIYNQVGMAEFASQMTPRLLEYAQRNEWLGRRIIDLGCGTGSSVTWFAGYGYNVYGVDSSPEMLEQTRQNLNTKSLNSTLITGDIRSLQIGEMFDMVLALDVLNELDSIRDLETVFSNVQQILSPNRFFIFDLHTVEGLTQNGVRADSLLHDVENLVVYSRESYDFERQVYLASYDIFNQENDNIWKRAKAQRILRGYPIQAVATLLRRQGFAVQAVLTTRFEQFDMNKPGTLRVIIVAKRS